MPARSILIVGGEVGRAGEARPSIELEGAGGRLGEGDVLGNEAGELDAPGAADQGRASPGHAALHRDIAAIEQGNAFDF